MKRRTFVRLVGASALGLPFVYGHLGSAGGKRRAGPAPNRQPQPLTLKFSPDEAALLAVLSRRAKSVNLLGGAVLAKAAGAELPYVNLLVDSAQFAQVKRDLFAFGVSPVATVEMPSCFIRFMYRGQPYSVLNLDREEFACQNVLGQQLELMPLAHNFLVYSIGEQRVLDPYGALQSRTARPDGFRSRLVEPPRSCVAGLEVCLAVAFDQALLGIAAPAGHEDFERQVLGAGAGQEPQAGAVFQRVVDYFPDLVELRGWDFARRYLVSPLCLSAAGAGPGVDLRRVEAAIRAVPGPATELSGAHLLAALHQEMCRVEKTPALAGGLADYLAARKLPLRRKDLLAEMLGDERAAV